MICTPQHGSVNTTGHFLIANHHDNAAIPNPTEITVQIDLATDETCTISGTIRWSSPEFFVKADRSCDGTDTDITWSLMRIRVWSSLTPLIPNPAAQSMMYIISGSRIALTITDNKFLIRPTMA